MRYWDCFLFFNEFDLLELRLKTLDEYVDHFVLVESPWTFSGKAKPLHYADNKALYERWNHKIIHVVQDDPMPDVDAWKREYRSRNVMQHGFADADPDDFIFQSDCDEIWDPRWRDVFPEERVVSYGMQHFFYFLNTRRVPGLVWIGTRRTRKKHWITGQALRTMQGEMVGGYPTDDGEGEFAGWHFSFLGGAERAQEKMLAYAHTEYSGPEWTDLKRLEWCVKEGRDMVDPAASYVPREVVEGMFPKPITEDIDRWRKHLRPVPPS